MYNVILHQYIKNRAKKKGIRISYNEIENKLKQSNLLLPVRNCKVVFSLWKAGFAKSIEATAIFPSYVICSYEWAVHLVISDSEDTFNAFLITLGHELAHKDGDFAVLFWERKSKRYIQKENRKFVNWVTEVHHDFAAQKMVNSSKEKLLASMDFKIKLKPNNEDGPSHPSWKQRKTYAETGAFNKALIETIAIETGCTNEKLIYRVAEYYQDIILR